MRSDHILLKAICESDFSLVAFQEYIEARTQNHATIMAMINRAYDEAIRDDPEVEDSIRYTQEDVVTIINENGFLPSSCVMIRDGVIELQDLLLQVNNVMYDEDQKQDDTAADYAGLPINYQVWDEETDGFVDEPITYAELGDYLQDVLHSITASAAAVYGFSKGTTVTERVSLFRDYLATSFSSAYSDFSGVAAQMVSIVKGSTNNSGFLQAFNDLTGVTDVADEKIHPSQTNLSQFTGVSPVAALSSQPAATIVGKAFSTGAKVVGGIVKGLFNVGKTLATKAVDYVEKTAVNPAIIEVVNEKALPGIDGMYFSKKVTTADLTQGNSVLMDPAIGANETLTIGLWDSSFRTAILKKIVNKWFKWQTVFGECLLYVRDIGITAGYEKDGLYKMSITYLDADYIWKPSCVDAGACLDILKQYAPAASSGWRYLTGSLVDYDKLYQLSGLIAQANASGSLLMSTSIPSNTATEQTKYCSEVQRGLRYASYLFDMCGQLDALYAYNTRDSYSLARTSSVYRSWWVDPRTVVSPVTANNATMAYAATGALADNAQACVASNNGAYTVTGTSAPWESAAYTFSVTDGYSSETPPDFNLHVGKGVPMVNMSLYNIRCPGLLWMLGALIIQEADKINYPIDFNFLPYSTSEVTLDPAAFRVKTDSEITAPLQNLVTAAIIVVAVAIVAGGAAIAIAKVSKRLYAKRLALKGQLDNAMWNGSTLNNKGVRKYRKLEKKLSGQSSMSSKLRSLVPESTGNESMQVATSNGSISRVISLITGLEE